MHRFVFALLALLCFSCKAPPNQEPPQQSELDPDVPTSHETSRDRKQNKKQNQVSPSGQYVLSVGTFFQLKALEPVHKVTIKSKDGTLLYEDKDSRFFAGLNVYFGWDDEDRAWLYNSDDGGIWCWELDGGSWRKSRSDEPAEVPDWILPDYAKEKR